jgi:hypothetical protein
MREYTKDRHESNAMPSLLDMLFGRGTPMATQNGEITGPIGEPQGGLLGGLRNSSGALMGFGMGMLGGANQQEGFQNGMVGMQRGVLTDRQRKAMQEAQMEKLRMQAARKGLAAKYGMDPALADVPGVQDRILADRLDPDSATRSDLLRAQLEAARRGPQPTETERLISGLPAEEQLAARRAAVGLGTKTTLADEVRMRTEEADRLGMPKDDPRRQSFILTGRMPREDMQPLSATDKKEIYKSEDALPVLDSTISTLQRAQELNRQAFSGTGAGLKGVVGTSNVPGSNLFIDRKQAEATREFTQIMSMESIKNMAETLKGATTDKELAQFVEILGNPATPPDIRERTITRMSKLAERQKQIAQERINELRGGTYFKPGGGQSGGDKKPAAGAADDPLGLR